MTDYKYPQFPDIRATGESRLRQCQLVMIRMLKILDYICSRQQIDYWMTSGTLIGAIRHKGFVPWDGDIDVGIQRNDLERLKKAMRELPYDIFYQDSDTDPHYPESSLVVKLRDRYSNYTEWQKSNPQAKWHNGLQVDLFLYDTDQLGRLVNPFKKTPYDVEEIFPCTRLEFEGAWLSAPKNYHSYISKRYGDYLKLPHPEHRIAHEGEADPYTACDHPESLHYEAESVRIVTLI